MILRQISYQQAAHVLGYHGPDLARRFLFKWYIEYLGGETYRIRGCMGSTAFGIARTFAMAVPAARIAWNKRDIGGDAMEGEMCRTVLWPEGVEVVRMRQAGLIG